MPTGRLGNAALLLVSFAVAIVLAEVFLRVTGVAADYWDYSKTRVAVDPEVLWRLEGHSRRDLNALGYRDYEFERDKGGRTRILLVGDSFLFGPNVPRNATLPKSLERLLGDGYEVFNMGLPGYGPDQSYARLLDDGLDFDPDVVVLSIYPGNDYNDLAKNELYVFGPGGELVYNPDNPVARALPPLRLQTLLRKAITGRGLAPGVQSQLVDVLGNDYFDLLADPESGADAMKIRMMRAVLRMFDDTLREAGADFHVVIIPTVHSIEHDGLFRRKGIAMADYFKNERITADLCEEMGLDYISLQYPFEARRGAGIYDLRDGHLSALGNRIAAESVATMLRVAEAKPTN